MDISNLSDQQVYTLCGIATYLTAFLLTICTAVVTGTLQRLKAIKPSAPPKAVPVNFPTRTPADELPVAA